MAEVRREMFTTPCCRQTFQTQGHRCHCGHYWDRQRMIQHDLIDEMFVFEEMELVEELAEDIAFGGDFF
jgi:hypothetical protein